MSHLFEQVDMLAAEALVHLEDSLVISGLCAKDVTSDFSIKPNGYSVGDVIRFKTRPSYQAKEFTTTVDKQSIREVHRSMTVEKHLDVTVELTAKELAMDFESFADQVIQPAAYALAEKVDVYVGTKILQGRGLFAEASVLSTAASMASARGAANYQQLNPAGRFGLVDSVCEARLLGAEYFNRSNYRGNDSELSLKYGIMGKMMNFDWFASQNFPASTITASTGTATTDNTGDANLIGDSTLKVDALAAEITAGNYLTIAGCRRKYIVATTASAAATSIALVDPIDEYIADGAAITITNDGATVTVRGALFDSNSLGVAFPVLDTPDDKVASTIADNGVSIRIVKGYDMSTKTTMMSLDLLCAANAIDPRRITLIGDAA